jgi:hypothetical protein
LVDDDGMGLLFKAEARHLLGVVSLLNANTQLLNLAEKAVTLSEWREKRRPEELVFDQQLANGVPLGAGPRWKQGCGLACLCPSVLESSNLGSKIVS